MIDPPNVMKLKVCMAGEGAVGKTSLIRRYVLDEYEDRRVGPMEARHPSTPGSLGPPLVRWHPLRSN